VQGRGMAEVSSRQRGTSARPRLMPKHSTRPSAAPPRVIPTVGSLRVDQQERRARVVQAAAQFMVATDYDRIQVKDVADAAGVALGTLYRYFNSKDHLFAFA